MVIHDTCGERGIALLETHQLIKWSRENMDDAPLIGKLWLKALIGLGCTLTDQNSKGGTGKMSSIRRAYIFLSKSFEHEKFYLYKRDFRL